MNTVYIDSPIDAMIPGLIVFLIALIFLGPIIWVLASDRSQGGAKFGWFLVVFFFSWLGLAIFLIVTQALGHKPRKQSLSVIKTGLLLSFLFFLISLTISLLIPPYSLETTPSFWMIFGYRALEILRWPMPNLNWPDWMWPIINLIQGFGLAALMKFSLIVNAAKMEQP